MMLPKKSIQDRLQEMGLHQIQTNGCGNTNDGNTARRAFSDIKLFTSMLQFDVNVLQNFHTILIPISCKYEAKTLIFQDFSKRNFVPIFSQCKRDAGTSWYNNEWNRPLYDIIKNDKQVMMQARKKAKPRQNIGSGGYNFENVDKFTLTK